MKIKLQIHKTLEPEARNLFFFVKSKKEDSMKKNNKLNKEATSLWAKNEENLLPRRVHFKLKRIVQEEQFVKIEDKLFKK